MRFLLITLIVHAPDPVTGRQKPTSARFREALDDARLAEELAEAGTASAAARPKRRCP